MTIVLVAPRLATHVLKRRRRRGLPPVSWWSSTATGGWTASLARRPVPGWESTMTTAVIGAERPCLDRHEGNRNEFDHRPVLGSGVIPLTVRIGLTRLAEFQEGLAAPACRPGRRGRD